MPTIYEKLRADIVTALKARDSAKALILRSADAVIQRTALDSNKPIDDDLVVATHGRSAWILDDLTPVREMPEVIGKAVNLLFPPRPAIRWYIPSDWSSPRGS